MKEVGHVIFDGPVFGPKVGLQSILFRCMWYLAAVGRHDAL